jgi:energy-coupling factor transporter ATP-binding protein EcfA2
VKPKIALLDELVHGLSIKYARPVLDIFKSMQQDGTTIVMSNHQMKATSFYRDGSYEV